MHDKLDIVLFIGIGPSEPKDANDTLFIRPQNLSPLLPIIAEVPANVSMWLQAPLNRYRVKNEF